MNACAHGTKAYDDLGYCVADALAYLTDFSCGELRLHKATENSSELCRTYDYPHIIRTSTRAFTTGVPNRANVVCGGGDNRQYNPVAMLRGQRRYRKRMPLNVGSDGVSDVRVYGQRTHNLT